MLKNRESQGEYRKGINLLFGKEVSVATRVSMSATAKQPQFTEDDNMK